MVLGRQAARPGPRSIQHAPVAENTTVAPGSYDGYIRGVSDLPLVIPNKEDRPIIQPEGKTHWKDIPIIRKGRRPISVLSCLLKRNHPGIADYKGQKLRYRYENKYSYRAKEHVRRCCNALLPSIFYYARIQAIIDHFRKVENTNMNDKLAGQYYLNRGEYLAQRQGWCCKEAWAALADKWCNPEWIEMSKTARANRVSKKYKPHKGGSNSMTTVSQKMSLKTGQEANQVEAWVHTHMGSDENNPLILNTPEASECLERYKKRAKELIGKDFDWKKNVVSSQALYDSSLGKPHGRWSLFNGIVNDTDIIAEVRAAGSSSAVRKRIRIGHMEEELRRESEKTQKAEDRANNVLSWGVGMYDHYTRMQKLLETLATAQGVPINEIPPPPIPPPTRSLSPPPRPTNILVTSEEPLASCAQQHVYNASFLKCCAYMHAVLML